MTSPAFSHSLHTMPAYRCWTVCPLHMGDDRCPCGCTYWKGRQVMADKAGAGLCAVRGCEGRRIAPTSLCEPCLSASDPDPMPVERIRLRRPTWHF
jgi:hypothetical protein